MPTRLTSPINRSSDTDHLRFINPLKSFDDIYQRGTIADAQFAVHLHHQEADDHRDIANGVHRETPPSPIFATRIPADCPGRQPERR